MFNRSLLVACYAHMVHICRYLQVLDIIAITRIAVAESRLSEKKAWHESPQATIRRP